MQVLKQTIGIITISALLMAALTGCASVCPDGWKGCGAGFYEAISAPARAVDKFNAINGYSPRITSAKEWAARDRHSETTRQHRELIDTHRAIAQAQRKADAAHAQALRSAIDRNTDALVDINDNIEELLK